MYVYVYIYIYTYICILENAVNMNSTMIHFVCMYVSIYLSIYLSIKHFYTYPSASARAAKAGGRPRPAGLEAEAGVSRTPQPGA